ncbi:MAG: NAD(P)-dependent oxidoreductase [Acidimicrobiales bacterium]
MTTTPARRDVGSQTLGWLGVGRMGSEMVRRLLRAGCDVAVYNRTREKAEPLAQLGAKVVDAVVDLAEREVVFITVGSSDDFLEVVLGDGGLLSGDAVPDVVVDCSTISEEASALARREAAGRGVALLAAPVSGNPKVARAGKLTMAVSGPRDVFDRVAGFLDLLGSGATYVGEDDVARMVKICHNLFLGVVTQSLVEVTVLAEKRGISRHAFLGYLNKSVMGSLFTTYKTPALVNLDFQAMFTTALLRKDFDLGLAAARQLDVPLPVAALVRELIQGLVGYGYGDSDFAALLALEARAADLALASEDAEVSDGLSPD